MPAFNIASNTRSSWHITDTAATFIPILYIVLAFFNFSQFISRTVLPADMPSICVCTAPATPTVHRSELLVLICGDIAEGGGLLIVVSVVPLDITVLSDLIVSSSSAYAKPPVSNRHTIINKRIIFAPECDPS